MRSLFLAVTTSLGLVVLGCTHAAIHSDDNPDYIAGIDDGTPFGAIGESDVDALMAFAKEDGVDLQITVERAYKKDRNALGTVFKFSTKFTTLEKNARTYGQMIWSCFLNLGETWGQDKLTEVLSAQDADVQQRIRDIEYYPIVHLPKSISERRAAENGVRKENPKLFPADYVFGRNDAVFH